MWETSESDLREDLASTLIDNGYWRPKLELIRIGNNYVYSDPVNKIACRVAPTTVAISSLVQANLAIKQIAANGAPILAPNEIRPLELQCGNLATVWPLGQDVEADLVNNLAPILASLHDFDTKATLPAWSDFERTENRLKSALKHGVPESLTSIIANRLQELRTSEPSWEATQLIHGDAHIGNVVLCEGSLRFIDFDDVARGCPEIDLSSPRASYRRFADVSGSWNDFVKAYDRPFDVELVDYFARVREVGMVGWLSTLWNERPETRVELEHRVKTIDKRDLWNRF